MRHPTSSRCSPPACPVEIRPASAPTRALTAARHPISHNPRNPPQSYLYPHPKSNRAGPPPRSSGNHYKSNLVPRGENDRSCFTNENGSGTCSGFHRTSLDRSGYSSCSWGSVTCCLNQEFKEISYDVSAKRMSCLSKIAMRRAAKARKRTTCRVASSEKMRMSSTELLYTM